MAKKKRFYIIKAWSWDTDDGSFCEIIEAKSELSALKKITKMMNEIQSQDRDEKVRDEYVTIDCFDIDEFIATHSKDKAA